MEKELKERFESLLASCVKDAADKPGDKAIHIFSTPADKNFGTIYEFFEAALEDGTAKPLRCTQNGDAVYDTLTALPSYDAAIHAVFTKDHYVSFDVF